MFWAQEKLAQRISELDEYRYLNAIIIPAFSFQEDKEGGIGNLPPTQGEWKSLSIGDTWKGRDIYAWLKAEIKIPHTWSESQIVGRFNFGRTGHGNTAGFESLLYVDGKSYQGVDTNHQEVFFDSNTAGTTVSLCFRLWSGLEGIRNHSLVHHLQQAEITQLDEPTDDLYYTAKAVIETIHILEENQPERVHLLQALDRSFLVVDWANPGSKEFYQSIGDARHILNEEIQKMGKINPITVKSIGHTHIDVAWLWRLKHTREKSARSFSTVLRLMEKFPEYIFLQTQPQLYDYIKSDYPDIYEDIKIRIKEGRWEADGGMWLEADCNIPSGESLVRQFLMGSRFLREEFKVECEYLWLPDVFGYSWALPQILKKSGIDTFMTTKISWNQYNRMPHDTFHWRGIDGTEILTHFITTPDAKRTLYTYNGVLSPRTVKGIWDNYQDKEVNQELLICYGYGDGGGGVNREMLEMRRRLNTLPGLPKVETSRANDYFKKLHETIKASDRYVHTWDGELYLEYHRGTYTSQAYNKLMNRKMEILYREAEWLSSYSGILESLKYPQKKLNDGWKIILRNQFHDIIPGSSIKEVYEDSKLEYQQAAKIGQEVWVNASNAIVEYSNTEKSYTVFNSASWDRNDLVKIPIEAGLENGIWLDGEAKVLTSQKQDQFWLVKLGNVLPMSNTAITFESKSENDEVEAPFKITESGIDTPFYKINWDKNGQITNIYDKEQERSVLAEGCKGNVFQIFEDKPMNYDAWDIDIYYHEKHKEVKELKNIEITSLGSLQATIRFEWEYQHSTISQKMIVYSESRRIDFQTTIDWYEQQQLLKVAFPVNVRRTEATYDIQFGNVKRSTHWNTSWDLACFESVGHQWADLSEQGYGVSLLNDCKYGYDIKDNVMRLSLIKSATIPDPKQDQGRHGFTYSLYPHRGSWIDGRTVQQAWDLNSPLLHEKGKSKHADKSMFRISSDNVFIDAVKKAEDSDDVILRVHEFTGSRGKLNISSNFVIKEWQEVDLMERPIGENQIDTSISDYIKPYEIKTYLVKVEL